MRAGFGVRWGGVDLDHSSTPWLPVRSTVGMALFGVAFGVMFALPMRLVGVTTPVWAYAVAGAVLSVGSGEPWQRLIGNGSLTNRPVLRTALALAQFMVLLNLGGLGFMLPVAGVVVAAVHIHRSGSRRWRWILRTVAAMTAAELALIAGGIPPTVIPIEVILAISPMLLGMSVVCIANLGTAARAQERLLDRLSFTERRFRGLVQNSSDVVAVLADDLTLSYVSPAAGQVLHLDPTALQGSPLTELVHPDDVEALVDHLGRMREGSAPTRWESRLATGADQPGAACWLEFTATDMTTDPDVAGIVLHIRDISERRAFQDRLAYTAAHDPLTGLYGRAELLQRAGPMLAGAVPDRPVAVLFCDLDRFKQVNDVLGHAAGDEVLVRTADRLRDVLRPDDVVARMGGDEFIVVLHEVAGLDAAEVISQRLRAAVAEPIVLAVGIARIGVSIGLVMVEEGMDVETVLQQADRLMYDEKHSGRTTVGT